MRKAIFLLGVMLILPFSSAKAKNLYVDTANGNDSVSYSQNSESNPWGTIGRAVWGSTDRSNGNSNEAARAGDVVIVQPGTYTARTAIGERYLPIWNPINSGTAGNPITIRANGAVTLRSSTSGIGEPIIGTYRKNYIVWDGFYLDEAYINTKSDTGPVVVWESDNVTIQNCEVKGNTATWADNHNAIRLERATNAFIRNNKVWNSYVTGTSERNGASIMLYYCSAVTIENNEIYNGSGGIFVKGANVGPVTIRYNLIYNVNSDAVALGGIGTAAGSNGAYVYQNILKDSNSGVTFIGYDSYCPRNVYIVNNVIDNCSFGLFAKPSINGYRDIYAWNNIVTRSTLMFQAEDIPHVNPFNFQHNLYYSNSGLARVGYSNYSFETWKSNFNQDQSSPQSVQTNPQFIDAGSNNYRLQNTSIANIGVDVLDLDRNNSSTNLISAGLYVTGDEVIGITEDLLPPGGSPEPGTIQAPANLTIVQ